MPMASDTLTINDVFDLPRPEDITALGFVVRLEDGGAAKNQQLVDDYVLTPAVRGELPKILKTMRDVRSRGEEHGRFVHGSFGSGKSHFMSFLGMLLEGDAIGWAKRDELMQELAAEHRDWIDEANLLVVRLHMLTVNKKGWGLDRAVYEAFNQTLTRKGKEPFEFVHVDGVLEEARREGEAYGDVFWHKLQAEGVVGSQDAFERMAANPKRRERLARAFLAFKGRDTADAGVDPNWAEGLERLTAHATEQGFGGVVLLIDEFLLWLSEKAGHEFKSAINDLNVTVDHTSGRRAAPLFVFVARQRNIREFFPDLADEAQIHEHLDHHSKRFEQTTLQDVELRHICRERVLKRKRPAEIEQALAQLADTHRKVLPEVLHNADLDYLRDVYPFHPAIIEMLIDLSALMQRERTALRLLYELLVLHHPDLPLGELLPVGRAFEAVFPETGVEGSKRVADLKAIHKLYWQQLKPAMVAQAQAKTAGGHESAARRMHVLDMLVKTVLLAEVSPRLKGTGGLTVERLVRLNDADVSGETDRGRIASAHQDLVGLSQHVPKLQVAGTGKTAVVSVAIQGVDFGEVLERARARTSGMTQRFNAFYEVMLDAVGQTTAGKPKPGFSARDGRSGTISITWRGTKRTGTLTFKNVREASYSDFKPLQGQEFRLLVDYPWDDPGHSVQEDRDRANQVRKSEGTQPTIAWLPRHLTPAELKNLHDFAACQLILSSKEEEDLLGNYGGPDRLQIKEQATTMSRSMRQQIERDLRSAYKDHGQAVALLSDVPGDVPDPELAGNVTKLASRILDRRFAAHPQFGSEPRTSDLKLLLAWMIRAANAPQQRAPLDDDGTARVMRNLAQPMELVELGQTNGRLRLESRYFKPVATATQTGRALWAPIDDDLAANFGLQPPVRNLFLAFLVHGQGFRARDAVTGDVVEVAIQARSYGKLRLERAEVLDAPAWSRLRELGPAVFGGPGPDAHRSVSEQDRYATQLRTASAQVRDQRTRLFSLVQKQAPGGALLEQLREVERRIRPLAREEMDSFSMLQGLLEAWPEDQADPLRLLTRDMGKRLSAASHLRTKSSETLSAAVAHGEHGAAVTAHLERMRELLGASDEQGQLTERAVGAWNDAADALVRKLIGAGSKPSPPEPVPGPVPGEVELFKDRELSLLGGDELGAFVGELRKELQALGHPKVRVSVSVRPEQPPKEPKA